MNAMEILARELGAGTFDRSCSTDERRTLRLYVYGSETKSRYVDLGSANGWQETPEIIKRCVEKKHSPQQTGVGRCLTEVKCELCRYKYLIDSSD